MTEQRKRRLRRQLQESRYRLRNMDSKFAEPLTDMLFVATKDVWKMSTNGTCIFFDPDWLQKLGVVELDFIISHQLMHIALGHIDRPRYYIGDRFHLACDIVANGNLQCLGWKYDRLPNIGRIFYETFFPTVEGQLLTSQEAFSYVPFDPATMKPSVRRNYMIDSDAYWDRKNDFGEQGVMVLGPDDEDPEDLRCDIKTTGGSHVFVLKEIFVKKKELEGEAEEEKNYNGKALKNWEQSAYNELKSLRDSLSSDKNRDHEASFVERVWQRAQADNLDWKKLLNSFIQEDVCDYSFTPPDKRFQDMDFYMPDYNVLCERPKEVWFVVDTSGSIGDAVLAMVYGEICNALMQFNGGLVGKLLFFDTRVYEPIPFADINDILNVRISGGGGTDYNCVFDYLCKQDISANPAEVVVFTDGCAEFPDEKEYGDIPVQWLLSNSSIRAPWGKCGYVDGED